MALIELKNISREYGVGSSCVKALNRINFEIAENTFNVIMGQSGSGKSTLLNLLGGMDYPNNGEIVVDNKDICKYTRKKSTNYRRLEVGFVFQFYNLIPSLTALENVAIAAKLVKNSLIPYDVLNLVGLKERMHHYPSQMSGGEMQRVAIARAICKNPKFILCDEPTGALDTNTGIAILKLLYDMVKQMNKTIIVVTHNDNMMKIADRGIQLKDGKIVSNFEGTPCPISDVKW